MSLLLAEQALFPCQFADEHLPFNPDLCSQQDACLHCGSREDYDGIWKEPFQLLASPLDWITGLGDELCLDARKGMLAITSCVNQAEKLVSYPQVLLLAIKYRQVKTSCRPPKIPSAQLTFVSHRRFRRERTTINE